MTARPRGTEGMDAVGRWVAQKGCIGAGTEQPRGSVFQTAGITGHFDATVYRAGGERCHPVCAR